MSIARQTLEALIAVTDDEAYSNLALKKAFSDCRNIRDKKLYSAVFYTVLEHLSHIDYILKAFVKGSQKKVIRGILRMGTAQILFMNRPDSAVCKECVDLAYEVGKSAMKGFINAVLRNICRAKDNDTLPNLPDDIAERLHIQTGYPLWFVSEYIERFGEKDTEKILSSHDTGLYIRPQYPYTADDFMNYLDKNGLSYVRGNIDSDVFSVNYADDITENSLFREGKITVQSESSCVCVMALGAKKGMKILDACAAPGGKSAYIYSMTEGQCDLYSCELHEHRTELIKNTFERLNVTATVLCKDMTVYDDTFREYFDAVLCDVPCSGLGVRGKPDVRYRKDAQTAGEIAALQYDILSNCSKYVKKGGIMLYSTCTVSRRENEDIIEKFMKEHDDFALEPTHLLDERGKSGMITLMPHTDDTDGFFMARMRKKI